jgi:hypothetical protein
VSRRRRLTDRTCRSCTCDTMHRDTAVTVRHRWPPPKFTVTRLVLILPLSSKRSNSRLSSLSLCLVPCSLLPLSARLALHHCFAPHADEPRHRRAHCLWHLVHPFSSSRSRPQVVVREEPKPPTPSISSVAGASTSLAASSHRPTPSPPP